MLNIKWIAEKAYEGFWKWLDLSPSKKLNSFFVIAIVALLYVDNRKNTRIEMLENGKDSATLKNNLRYEKRIDELEEEKRLLNVSIEQKNIEIQTIYKDWADYSRNKTKEVNQIKKRSITINKELKKQK